VAAAGAAPGAAAGAAARAAVGGAAGNSLGWLGGGDDFPHPEAATARAAVAAKSQLPGTDPWHARLNRPKFGYRTRVFTARLHGSDQETRIQSTLSPKTGFSRRVGTRIHGLQFAILCPSKPPCQHPRWLVEKGGAGSHSILTVPRHLRGIAGMAPCLASVLRWRTPHLRGPRTPVPTQRCQTRLDSASPQV
jgi:hypothetical protein